MFRFFDDFGNYDDDSYDDEYDYGDSDSYMYDSDDMDNYRRTPPLPDDSFKWMKDWDNKRVSNVQLLPTNQFTNNFKSYFNQASTSDVTLRVGRHSFSCHRLILCAWSEVFSKMLDDPNWNINRKKPNSSRKTGMFQELKETPECTEVFHDFLEFLYTENIRLNLQNVWPIVLLADKYMVSELRDLCVDFVIKQLDSVMLDEVWTVMRNAEACLMNKVYTASMATLRANFVNIPTISLIGLSPEEVLLLLDSNDIVVEDEFHLFTKISDFLSDSKSKLSFTEDFKIKVLKTLRLHQMSASQLSVVAASKIMPAIRKAHGPKLLEDAFKYRAQFAEECTGKLPKDVPPPRLYLHNSHFLRYNTHNNNVTYKRALKKPEPITLTSTVTFYRDVSNVFYIQEGKPFLCQKSFSGPTSAPWTYRPIFRNGSGRKSQKKRVTLLFVHDANQIDYKYKIIIQVLTEKGRPSYHRVKVVSGVVKKPPGDAKYEVKISVPGYVDVEKGKGLTVHLVIYMYVPPGNSLKPNSSKKSCMSHLVH